MCTIKVDLPSATFDPERAEIHFVIVTQPVKIQHFSSLTGFPLKGHWTQANEILHDVRGLKGLTIHRKNLGKVNTQKFSPA